MSIIVVPTQTLVLKFSQTTLTMTVMDYNLDDVGRDIVSALTYDREAFNKSVELAEKYKHITETGIPNTSMDADIISRAVYELSIGMGEVFRVLGLYGSDGILPFIFSKWIGNDLVLKAVGNS